jgi:hypothetical protein
VPRQRLLPDLPRAAEPGAGARHGDAARKNIVACAGCHDQGAASVCVVCHQVGGYARVNPHPGSWKKTTGDIAKNAMCLACHR